MGSKYLEAKKQEQPMMMISFYPCDSFPWSESWRGGQIIAGFRKDYLGGDTQVHFGYSRYLSYRESTSFLRTPKSKATENWLR